MPKIKKNLIFLLFFRKIILFCKKDDNNRVGNLLDMEKLILIDGNSLLNRAFYATPVFTTKDGTPTNAVFGFIKLFLKILSDKKPTHAVVAFDLHAPTFRHKKYSDYKAGRKPMPQELALQMPIMKDMLRAMNVCVCEKEGYEADDIIGTLAKRFSMPTYIYTGDRDSYQLVDETTTVCYTKRGVSDLLELTSDNFFDEIGLNPLQIIDLKALMGDKSDNIPGVAGVGEKSAYSLLTDYSDLDGVYAHIDEIKGALQKKLIENKETAYFSKELATICTDAPVEVTPADCIIKKPFPYALKERFAELEFRSLLTMSIYEDEPTEVPIPSTLNEPISTQRIVASIEEFSAVLSAFKGNKLSVYRTEKGVHVYLQNPPKEIQTECVEYYFPIREGLLDVGFFESELVALYELIFKEGYTVVSYNVKELLHYLQRFEINPTCAFEDVSILKCIADGLSNTDGVDFCLQYNGLPAEHLAYGVFRLYEIYYSTLNEQEKELYKNVELPLVKVLFDMELEGISIDEANLNALSKKYSDELKGLTEKIYQAAGEVFNINSTQRLGKILFEKLGIGAGAKKAKTTKSYKTTAEELEKYVDEHEIISLILRYRQVQKLNSTYIEGFKPLIKSGKVHTTYNQTATTTGRLSSANPNLQNIPVRSEEGKELRKLFCAKQGNVLLDADYSQIELRLLAHFSGCKELIEAYNAEKDIHAITASQVFNVPLEEVTGDLRRQAKAVNFGIIYGISAFGLSKDLNISARQAQGYIDRYFESYSSVKGYMENNVLSAKEKGYTVTLLGRRRVINELKSSNYNVRSFGERAAMNMPLQGSSADIIKLAMIGVANELKKGGYQAKLVLQVHDELVIDCPIDEKEAVSKILKSQMENAVRLSVPLTVDVGVGENWYNAK